MTSVAPALSLAPAPRASPPARRASRPGARGATPPGAPSPPAKASRRAVFGATLSATISSLLASPVKGAFAAAEEGIVVDASLPSTSPARLGDLAAAAPGAEVYFGNGCFWGRQHEFVQTERTQLGRTDDEVSSLVGYAGGFSTKGKDGKVCYYYGSPDTVYERLGHGEVVRTVLSDASPEKATEDLRAFARTYFANFKKIRGFGMQRLDPQDAGAGYRNMIGVPGGMDSPLMKIIEEENVNGMRLLAGEGNKPNQKPSEDDVFNAVWIYDSSQLPFYPAEVYHQFHDGLGYRFPEEYTVELKKNAMRRGLVKETGCPEMRERRFAEFESIAS